MNSEQVPQTGIQKLDTEDYPESDRRAELNPDDFSEAGEPGLENMPSEAGDVPSPEWNPDDFPENEQQSQ